MRLDEKLAKSSFNVTKMVTVQKDKAIKSAFMRSLPSYNHSMYKAEILFRHQPLCLFVCFWSGLSCSMVDHTTVTADPHWNLYAFTHKQGHYILLLTPLRETDLTTGSDGTDNLYLTV